jgi:hypothetical protein
MLRRIRVTGSRAAALGAARVHEPLLGRGSSPLKLAQPPRRRRRRAAAYDARAAELEALAVVLRLRGELLEAGIGRRGARRPGLRARGRSKRRPRLGVVHGRPATHALAYRGNQARTTHSRPGKVWGTGIQPTSVPALMVDPRSRAEQETRRWQGSRAGEPLFSVEEARGSTMVLQATPPLREQPRAAPPPALPFRTGDLTDSFVQRR